MSTSIVLSIAGATERRWWSATRAVDICREELCAWIKTRAGESLDEADVRSFCQGQIAHFKIPRFFRFVEAFPMTVSGKPQKYKMREQMIEELGLTVQRTA